MNIKHQQPGPNSAVLTHECSTFFPITHWQTASYPATAWSGNKMYLFTTDMMKTTTMAMMKTSAVATEESWQRIIGLLLLWWWRQGGGAPHKDDNTTTISARRYHMRNGRGWRGWRCRSKAFSWDGGGDVSIFINWTCTCWKYYYVLVLVDSMLVAIQDNSRSNQLHGVK